MANPIESQIIDVTQRIKALLEERQAADLDTVLFIPVTGGEGAGKSTLIRSLLALFDGANIRSEIIKMLGGTQMADRIRELALSSDAETASPQTMKLVFQAAMSEAGDEARNIARESGSEPVVIFADRSPFDTAAYQSYATQQQPRDEVIKMAWANLNLFAELGILPTVTAHIALDPEIGLARKFDFQPDEVNRFEEMGLEFHRRVAEGFQLLMEDPYLSRFFVQLAGTLPPEELLLTALQQIEIALQENEGKVVVGQPMGLESAQFWLDRIYQETGSVIIDPEDLYLVFRIFETAPFEKVGDLKSVFEEILRPLFFRLRDSKDMTSEQKKLIVDIIREKLLESDVFKMIVVDFGQSENFLERFSSLSDEEMIVDGWQYINRLWDDWKYCIRRVETRDYGQTTYPYIRNEE